jgi:hypothetical protein
MIEEITILGGFNKQGNPEPVKKVVIKKGEIFWGGRTNWKW